jgi:hypothetical protein
MKSKRLRVAEAGGGDIYTSEFNSEMNSEQQEIASIADSMTEQQYLDLTLASSSSIVPLVEESNV